MVASESLWALQPLRTHAQALPCSSLTLSLSPGSLHLEHSPFPSTLQAPAWLFPFLHSSLCSKCPLLGQALPELPLQLLPLRSPPHPVLPHVTPLAPPGSLSPTCQLPGSMDLPVPFTAEPPIPRAGPGPQ